MYEAPATYTLRGLVVQVGEEAGEAMTVTSPGGLDTSHEAPPGEPEGSELASLAPCFRDKRLRCVESSHLNRKYPLVE